MKIKNNFQLFILLNFIKETNRITRKTSNLNSDISTLRDREWEKETPNKQRKSPNKTGYNFNYSKTKNSSFSNAHVIRKIYF